jgi:hypothetical protein
VSSAAGRRIRDGRERIKRRMVEAEAHLEQAGHHVLLSVRWVCERDKTLVGHQDLLWLREGLDRLARLWKLSR